MSVFLLWIVLAGGPNDSLSIDPKTRVASQREPVACHSSEPRPLVEIRKELGQLLREEATAEDRRAWHAAVVELVRLYGEIACDERLATSKVLNGYRLRLRRRLLGVQKRLERELAREERDRSPAAVQDPAAGQDRAEALGRSAASLSDGSEDHLPFGARGGAPVDDGMALVELIQRTISPEFWDVNGGPGTIFYYRQWHALVVRATSEIHERIGGVMGGLRK